MTTYFVRCDIFNNSDTLTSWGIVSFSAKDPRHAARKLRAGLDGLEKGVRRVYIGEAKRIQLDRAVYETRGQVSGLRSEYKYIGFIDLSRKVS